MLSFNQIRDTLEKIQIKGIEEDCIITNTHLVGIINVGGANLFEKKEEDSVKYMLALANTINNLGFPVQLITQSRPKNFNDYIAKIKEDYKDNNFRIKFEKDLEWFRLYYGKDLENKKVTKEEIEEKFEKHSKYIDRSMLDSYSEILSTIVENNNIFEKKYYLVVSTLDIPTDITEKSEQDYHNINFDDKGIFARYKLKLEDRVDKVADLIERECGMWARKTKTNDLENIAFDFFNYPLSGKHRINRNITEYGKVPPILENGTVVSENTNTNNGFVLKNMEKVCNYFLKKLDLSYTKKVNVFEDKSNQLLQTIKPYSIDDSNLNYTKVNSQYIFSIHIDSFGKEYLEDLVLWPILTLENVFDLSVHIIPLNKDKILREYKKQILRIEKDFSEKIKKGSTSDNMFLKDEAEAKIGHVQGFEGALKNNRTLIYSCSIDVSFRCNSYEEMLELKNTVKNKLAGRRINFSETIGNHYDGFISTCPLLINLVAGYNRPFKRIVKLTEEIAHLYPYCPGALSGGSGVLLGMAVQSNGEDVSKYLQFFDMFNRDLVLNSIFAIIGQSGSGKTTTIHGFVKYQKLLGYRFLMLDYLGNYPKWAADMPDEFRVIKIDNTSNDKVNPCDIFIPNNNSLESDESYKGKTQEEIKNTIIDSKISELSTYYSIFLKKFYEDPQISGILDDITKKVYQKALKHINIYEIKYYGDVMLSDIVNELNDNDHTDIGNMISRYATGSYSGMFNSKTNIKLDNKDIVFSLQGNKSAEYKEIATLHSFILIQNILYTSRKNILVIDELAKILKMEHREIQSFFSNQVATIRNLKGGIIGATQFLSQILDIPAGVEFLNMATSKLYLAGGIMEGQDDTDVAKYDTTLSESSKSFLKANNRPGFGIFKVGGEQIQIQIQNHADLSLYERYSVEESQAYDQETN